MNIVRTYWLVTLCTLVLWLSGLLAGCGGGGSPATEYVSTVTSPQAADYAVVTPNYYSLYDQGDGSKPFPNSDQFADRHFPIPITYVWRVTEPEGVDLVENSLDAIRAWAKADPRICVVSGAPASSARIHLILEDTIAYGAERNVIGLTSTRNNPSPGFTVQIATRYRLGEGGYFVMTPEEIQKTITHELGHALGLGHSPEKADLMYYQSNAWQGVTYATFLTYGDAMALWMTLNAHRINWVVDRPTVSYASMPSPVISLSRAPVERGTVIDVYRYPGGGR